jgi:hypothetical protein
MASTIKHDDAGSLVINGDTRATISDYLEKYRAA